jgi:hypothetical protein
VHRFAGENTLVPHGKTSSIPYLRLGVTGPVSC